MSDTKTNSSGSSFKGKSMRAFAVQKFGDVPKIHNLPVPFAENGILIRVNYAGVNPVDYKLVERLTTSSKFPFILGVDFAGIVENIPSGEHNFKIGDRVFGQARTYGTYTEYTMVIPGTNLEPLTHIPAGVSDEQAAALPVAAITALGSLHLLDLHPGQTIAVLGAIGGVGGYTLEMARSRGLNIIATIRGDKDEAHRLGAKEVYDINTGDVFKAIHSSHPDGVDAILDLVNGPEAIRRDIEILKSGGKIVSGIYAADVEWFSGHKIVAHNIGGNNNPLISAEGLDQLTRMVLDGTITARIRSTVTLDEAGKLLDKLKHGGIRGKSLVKI